MLSTDLLPSFLVPLRANILLMQRTCHYSTDLQARAEDFVPPCINSNSSAGVVTLQSLLANLNSKKKKISLGFETGGTALEDTLK